ncbi:MAG TPA: hypothetical protein VNX47_04300 [Nevskia sp.]|nr:hypothetical protein [Nevskia sp.]
MPNPRFLLIALLPLAAAAAPDGFPLDRPGLAPVQPCLADTLDCLRLAPEPFRPCLVALQACDDHFLLVPAGSPRFTPAALMRNGSVQRGRPAKPGPRE